MVLGAFRHHANPSAETTSLVVVFSEPVKFRAGALCVVEGEKSPELGDWTPAHHIANHFSHIWTLQGPSSLPAGLTLKVDSKGILSASDGSPLKQDAVLSFIATTAPSASAGVTPGAKKDIFNEPILQNELKSITELLELEPDCKCKLPLQGTSFSPLFAC